MAAKRPHLSPRGACVAGALLAAIAAIAATAAPAAGPGSPSRGFGQNGIATLRSDSRLHDALVQKGGKVLVVGEAGRADGRVRLLVQRLTRRGRPDPRFHGGKPFLGPVGTVGNSVAVRRDGRIVVAGTVTDRKGGDQRGMLVIRLKPGGARDRSFAGDGKAVAFRRTRGQGFGVALRGGGRVVVAGSSTPLDGRDGYDRVAVAAFRANGRADRHFGRRGRAVLEIGRLAAAEDVAVRRDGRIVLAGSERSDLQTTRVLAARLRPGGSLDRSFAGDGAFVRQYAKDAAYSTFRALTLRKGGRLLLAGTALTLRRGPEALVVQLDARGRPDRRFDGDGAVYVPAAKDNDQYTEVAYAGAFGVTLAGDEIVIGGFHDNLGLRDAALWALRGRGTIDRRFGRRGHVFRQYSGNNATFEAVARAGRRLVVAGERAEPFGDGATGIVGRYFGP